MSTPAAAALLDKCDDFLYVASKLDEALTKLLSKNLVDENMEDSEGVFLCGS